MNRLRNGPPPPTRKSFQFASENAVGVPGMLVRSPTEYRAMNTTGRTSSTTTNASGGSASAPLRGRNTAPRRRGRVPVGGASAAITLAAPRSGGGDFLPCQFQRGAVGRPALQVDVG